jgi:hypothetical protein
MPIIYFASFPAFIIAALLPDHKITTYFSLSQNQIIITILAL